MPRASVVIPCHDKPKTLPLTVDTVLRQSVHELEVLLLGDGVTDEVRAVADELVTRDARVRFLDFPKGPHHGEKYRHDAVMAARSDAVFYLCDDDLLLPEHVADLLTLLEHATLVQCLNGFIRPDGTFGTYAADLATVDSVAPVLDPGLRFNSVSVTGTAHSRTFYLAVGAHWETTPPGIAPDHHQWMRMMSHPDFVGATSRRMTALQLPTSLAGRDEWTQDERLEELARWHSVVVAPGGQEVVDEAVHVGAIADLARHRPALYRQRAETADLRARLAEATRENESLGEQLADRDEQVTRLRRRLRRVRAARRTAVAEVAALRGSRSWRLTAPVRAGTQAVRRVTNRLSARRLLG